MVGSVPTLYEVKMRRASSQTGTPRPVASHKALVQRPPKQHGGARRLKKQPSSKDRTAPAHSSPRPSARAAAPTPTRAETPPGSPPACQSPAPSSSPPPAALIDRHHAVGPSGSAGCRAPARPVLPLGRFRPVAKLRGAEDGPQRERHDIRRPVEAPDLPQSDVVALWIPSKDKKVTSVVVPLRDFVFSAYVFPIGLFVAVAFWGLYAYDRELVYPRELDKINPTWLNHTMHTTILPLLFIELVICPHKYPSRFKGILGLAVFAFLYLSWILWVNYASGIWAYPVLGVLDPCGKAVFISIAFLIMVAFYFVGEQLTIYLWSRRRKKCT